MNFDEIKGKAQNAFGKAEEAVGNAIGSQNLANAGAEDRVKGAATETWGNAKDAVGKAGDTAAAHASDARSSAAYEAGRADGHIESGNASLRDRIVSGAERFQENVNAKIDNFKAEHDAKKDHA
jgi:uncharacterized protein YjbJ (UPF0337 family)